MMCPFARMVPPRSLLLWLQHLIRQLRLFRFLRLLKLALFHLAEGDFEKTVTYAANFGRDADTIAAMGGAIAGTFQGIGGIPSDWVEKARLVSFDYRESGDHITVRSSYSLDGSNSEVSLEYKVRGADEIHVGFSLSPQRNDLPELPRIGTRMILEGEFQNVSWFGRGPHESYADRFTGAAVGLYKGTVWEQYHPYVRPQETGNKTDVRWMALENNEGYGLLVKADSLLNCSAWQFAAKELAHKSKGEPNRHGTDVKPGAVITLNIDLDQMGVGGDNSWGAKPLDGYRIFPDKPFRYGFTLKPYKN